jgi:hypothetical protein
MLPPPLPVRTAPPPVQSSSKHNPLFMFRHRTGKKEGLGSQACQMLRICGIEKLLRLQLPAAPDDETVAGQRRSLITSLLARIGSFIQTELVARACPPHAVTDYTWAAGNTESC